MNQQWYVYIVRCADGTLYTGITTDLVRRIEEHNGTGKGARYTRGRQPVELVYSERAVDRSEAGRREYLIKQMSQDQKRALINQTFTDGTGNRK